MGLEIGDGDLGVFQARLLWDEVNPAPTWPAAAEVTVALLTEHIERNVMPAPVVLRRTPLEDHRRLVNVGNQVERSRGWF